MANKIIFIVFIFFGLAAMGQIPKNNLSEDVTVFPEEKVSLTINSNILLAGEALQYKAFILDGAAQKSKLSKIVYVSLRNKMDSVVFSHKLKVENGSANGDFFIPSTLKTGDYRLIGYTNFSRNNTKDSYTHERIFILNSFIKQAPAAKSADTVRLNFAPNELEKPIEKNAESGFIKITTDKNYYNLREKVKLRLENLSGNTVDDFVLSVRKVNPIKIPENGIKEIAPQPLEIFYIPEIRGEIISGVVISKNDGKPVANKQVSLTIPGKDFIFKLARSNQNGRFFFSIAEAYEAEKSMVQLIDEDLKTANYIIVMDEKDFRLDSSESKYLKLDTELKNWLQERSVQVQVENAYFNIKKDSILSHDPNPDFFDNLGTVYILDDYTRFPSVRETFVEVITLAAIRGSGENARFSVNNTYNPNGIAKFNDIPPLVLMDGLQIQNNEELIDYNPREIKSIRVINQPYRYGPKIYSGIISVLTKSGTFFTAQPNYSTEINLSATERIKKLYFTDYGNNASLARIPDYRVQLLWQPKLFLKNSQSIGFYTSDVAGTYQIALEGYNNEGLYISSTAYFTVQTN
ncbi:hypothetical protein QRD02_04680 [Aequorivita sp. SDUM287046]|uniref:Macroglobulin domain-containing protein n=1 Tax=Aequorivita aurantiaca TaxID=3053356 RepID=A0ABT8DI75_9FLAO|nr:hypothetical protein [Aequorivita aurantiaca]MDN3723666.1 hypothetical protein [Aequorivita aurantiaca]